MHEVTITTTINEIEDYGGDNIGGNEKDNDNEEIEDDGKTNAGVKQPPPLNNRNQNYN